MDNDPLVRLEAPTCLQAILDAQEWVYIGNTTCEPRKDAIRVVGAAEGVTAWLVYEALGLDIIELMRIYPNEEVRPSIRGTRGTPLLAPEESDAPTYRALHYRSTPWHQFLHWSHLARLTGRVIHFHWQPLRDGSDGRDALVTFHPNGGIEEHLSFVRMLRNAGSFDDYVAYKRGIADVIFKR
ncbi:hypothetical protein KJ925_02865 [Patescibacteria group bacterium]|nr:hypothetical protein [Patescibacteria group bacterium]